MEKYGLSVPEKGRENFLSTVAQLPLLVSDAWREWVESRWLEHSNANREMVDRRNVGWEKLIAALKPRPAVVFPDDSRYDIWDFGSDVGGKNNNLRWLQKQMNPNFGVKIPEFFMIPDGVSSDWLENNSLTNPQEVEIQNAVFTLENIIRSKGYTDKLLLAVRSSGTAKNPDGTVAKAGGEDDVGKAFAGKNDTQLFITPDDSLAAVNQVMSSCGNPIARDYVQQMGVDPDVLRMSVVVQRMVLSCSVRDMSGVIFTRSKSDPNLGIISFVHGANEYCVGSKANGGFDIYFDRRTGDVVRTDYKKQERMMIFNPYYIRSRDTKLDIPLNDECLSRINLIDSKLSNDQHDDEFFDLIKEVYGIEIETSQEDLIECALNYIKIRDFVLEQSRELTSSDESSMYVSEDDVKNLILQSLELEEKVGFPCDIEHVSVMRDDGSHEKSYVQLRAVTAESVAMKDGPESSLKELVATGKYASPGVVVGEVYFVTGHEKEDKEAFKGGKICVVPVADPAFDWTYAQSLGILAQAGTVTGHASISGNEEATKRSETGFPYVILDPNSMKGINNGDIITVHAWSKDGKVNVYKGEDLELLNKWNKWYSENAYIRPKRDFIRKPNGDVLKIGIINGDPEASLAAYNLGVSSTTLFRFENIYRKAVNNSELPEEAQGNPIHPLWYFENNKQQILEDHLYNNLARAVNPFFYNDREEVLPFTVRALDFQAPDMKMMWQGQKYVNGQPPEGALMGQRGAFLLIDEPRLLQMEAKVIARILDQAKEKGRKIKLKYMVPFVRNTEDIKVFEMLEENGLFDGEDGLQFGIMAEVPSIRDYLKQILARRSNNTGRPYISFVSIGSNDLYQMAMGVFRNDAKLKTKYTPDAYFIECWVKPIADICYEAGVECSFCGNAPSEKAEIAAQLYHIPGITEIGVTSSALRNVDAKLYEEANNARESTRKVWPWSKQSIAA